MSTFEEDIRRTQYTVKREVAATAIGTDVGTMTRILEGTRALRLEQVEPFAAVYGYQIIPVGFAAIDPTELAAIRTLAEAYVLTGKDLPVTPEIKQAMTHVAAGMAKTMLKDGCEDMSDEVLDALRVLNKRRFQGSLTPANASPAIALNNHQVKASHRRKR